MAARKHDAFDMSLITDALNSGSLLDAFKAKQTTAFLENLSPMVQKRVEVLKQIQSEHDELEAKFFEERRALEDKYQKLYQPLYSKRYDVVNGVVEVDGVSDEPADEAADKTTKEKGVPNFWFIAMKTNEVLAETIKEQDEDALKYLKDIKSCRVDVSKVDNHKGEATKGFKLEFFFDTNPFFNNSVLTKTYLMIDEDEPILEKAIGTEIGWFPGKCLTEKVMKKKPRKGSKNSKPITKTVTVDSFFNFFNPPEVPEDDEDLEEEAAEELQSMMELDYDVGSTIREKIIPHAVSWFTGEADQDDDFDLGDEDVEDDDDEEDDEDEEDEDEEDDDDDDDEDDDKANSQKKGSAKTQGREAKPAGEKPPECKQQ